jgi:hypothetical protein
VRPNFPIAFPREGRITQHGFNMLHQKLIRTKSGGAATLSRRIRLQSLPALRIKGRPGQPPDPADSTQGIDFGGRGRSSPAYFFDLRHRKGYPASRRLTFWWSSSHSMVTSHNFSLSLVSSASLLSAGSFFKAVWPACRNFSRHWESWAAVTFSSRESNSISSPCSRCKTIVAFCLKEYTGALTVWPPCGRLTMTLAAIYFLDSFGHLLSYFIISKIGVQNNCRPGENSRWLPVKIVFRLPYSVFR